MNVLRSLLIISVLLSQAAIAQDVAKSTALTFQDWKEHQVLEAQNQVLRNGSRLSQLKVKKPGIPENKDGAIPVSSGSARVKKISESDNLAMAEKDLRRSQESLEAANKLEVGDYISIYLPSLQDQPEALSQLTEKLSKEELAEIVKGLVSRPLKSDDAKRSGKTSLLTGVSVSSNNKTP